MLTVNQAAPSHDLTTLEAVKQMLALTTDEHDDLLTALITRVSAAIARFTDRVFGRETVTETLEGSGRVEMVLERVPVVSVSEARLNGEPVGDVVITNREAGLIFTETGFTRVDISRTFIQPWPTGKARIDWELDYVGGFWLPSFPGSAGSSDILLPADVEQAAIETVRAWFATRGEGRSADVTSERLGDWAASYGGAAAAAQAATMLPDRVRADLARNWKRVRI